MSAEEQKEIFLSCFKCGRIVRSSDSECPRCGLQFGPGTLFECPFCCGLVWRNATVCSTCGVDLVKFSESAEKVSAGFDMDSFVDNIIKSELEEIKSTVRRVSCPGCGLMIRGDETKCPRCDLPLEEAEADCPVCGEKIPISANSCPNCKAVFEKAEGGPAAPEGEAAGTEAEPEAARSVGQAAPEAPAKAPRPKKAVGKAAPRKRAGAKKAKARPSRKKRY